MTFDRSTEDRLVRLLLDLAPHVSIARHDPGRIEIKVRLSGVPLIRDAEVAGLPDPIPGIRHARVKVLSRLVDIEYDPGLIPFELWEDLAAADNREGPDDGLADRLRAVLRGQPPVAVPKKKGETA